MERCLVTRNLLLGSGSPAAGCHRYCSSFLPFPITTTAGNRGERPVIIRASSSSSPSPSPSLSRSSLLPPSTSLSSSLAPLLPLPPPRRSPMSEPLAAAAGGPAMQAPLPPPQKKHGNVRVFDTMDDLVTSLADYVVELSEAAVKERGYFSVVLSGGSLISSLRKLCEPPHLKTIDWSRWHVFWADERVVPKNHPDSNYKLAKDGLLSKVPILPGHVYSINDSLPAEGASDDYEFGLRQVVKTKIVGVSSGRDCPRFDLILLGMGPDGHVASLFPNHPLVNEKEKWVAFITDSPKPPPERITLTLPVINSAANVVMYVTGANKADMVHKVFGEELPPGVLPAQMVSPVDGVTAWFLDKDAAAKCPELSQSE